MRFTQYIAPSVILAGSAVAANIKRDDHLMDAGAAYGGEYADTPVVDAGAYGDEYADKPVEEYAGDYKDNAYAYGDEHVEVDAAPVYNEDYSSHDWTSSWTSEYAASTVDGAAQPTYAEDYDMDYDMDYDEGTVVAQPTGEWMGEDYDDDYEMEYVDAEEDCVEPKDDAMVQIVKVSDVEGNLVFSPNDIKAPVGSHVQFQFWPKNHSIVQSDFANPCVPISDIMPNVTGMFSGFMPVSPDSEETPVFTYEVKDEKPVWFYCSQGMHCQSGMGGVINAPADKTVQMYIEAAANAADNVTPKYEMTGGATNGTMGGNYCYGGDSTKTSSSISSATSDSSEPTTPSTSVPTGSSNGTATDDEPLQASDNAGTVTRSTLGGFAGLAVAAAVAVVAL